MTKIGIVGLGFVGTAVKHFFSSKSEISLRLYDKYKENGIGSIKDTLDTEIVFLCLPTPFDKYQECYDLTALYELCNYLRDHLYDGIIVIKSTVLPGTCQKLADEYNLSIIHNPEFLTARTADSDFANQKHIVLGATRQGDHSIDWLAVFYRHYFPDADISITSSDVSEAMKVFCNSFYATKVQIFTEFYLLCQRLHIDYKETRDLMLKNGWINPMHTNVPGPDGKISFGGLCFVKDIQALITQMREFEVCNDVLSAAINERDRMRPE